MTGHRAWRADPAPADPGPAPGFSGDVAIATRAQEPDGTTILEVVFAAGARTEWHRHERGQFLESVRGRGWVEERGGARRELRPGDRVWCPPGAVHRHGAAADGPWQQLSVTLGATTWLGDAPEAGDLPASAPHRKEHHP